MKTERKKRRLFTIDPKKIKKKKCELVFVFCLFGGVRLCVWVCVQYIICVLPAVHTNKPLWSSSSICCCFPALQAILQLINTRPLTIIFFFFFSFISLVLIFQVWVDPFCSCEVFLCVFVRCSRFSCTILFQSSFYFVLVLHLFDFDFISKVWDDSFFALVKFKIV